MKSAQIHIQIHPEQKAAAEAAAKADARSLSSWVAKLISDALKKEK